MASPIQYIRENWPEGPVDQAQTGPAGKYIGTKLARQASTSGPNWPEGPVDQHKTGSQNSFVLIV